MFKQIDKEDIDSVEQFVREELSAMWQNKTIELVYGSELKDAFGPFYAFNPTRFKFLPGDRKLIEKLVAHMNGLETEDKISTNRTIKSKGAINDSSSAELLPEHDFAYRTNFFLNKLQSVANINFSKKGKEGFRFDDEIQMWVRSW